MPEGWERGDVQLQPHNSPDGTLFGILAGPWPEWTRHSQRGTASPLCLIQYRKFSDTEYIAFVSGCFFLQRTKGGCCFLRSRFHQSHSSHSRLPLVPLRLQVLKTSNQNGRTIATGRRIACFPSFGTPIISFYCISSTFILPEAHSLHLNLETVCLTVQTPSSVA
jgi:hypothetical protein